MDDFEKFFTREAGSDGIEVPLHRPDGTQSENKLVIRSVDSDEWKAAELKAQRDVVAAMEIKDDTERDLAIREIQITQVCSLVKSWTFPQPEFNKKNLFKLLREAPQLMESIQNAAGRRSLFVKKSATTS